MTGLLDTVTGALSTGLGDRIAGELGEAPGVTMSALKSLLPVALGAMLNKADHGDTHGLTDLIKGVLAGGNPLDDPERIPNALHHGADNTSATTSLTQSLFGASLAPIVDKLAGQFNLHPDSIRKLLGAASLLGIGGIGRHLGSNPEPDKVAGLLQGDRTSILGALPAGLGALLGLTSAGSAHAAPSASTYTEEKAAGSGMGKWLPWLALALLALGLIFGMKSCNRDAATEGTASSGNADVATTDNGATPANTPANTGATDSTAAAPAPAAIPTGSGVTAETRNNHPALNVYFDVGKSAVTNDLAKASAPLKTYLDANPAASLTVSGFNDPTGNAAANAELSKKRAQQVAAALEAAGIAKASIKLEKPAAATGTGDSNAASRRVEVTIKD